MDAILSQPFPGILLCIAAYAVGCRAYKKLNTPLAHPLVVGQALMILAVTLTPLKPEQVRVGGDIVALFILPATTVFSLYIHRQWARFKANLVPVFAGCAAGAVVSIVGVVVLCRLFGIGQALSASLQPKSVTTAIALELSDLGGGIGAITLSAVIFTGIIGAVFCPLLIKWFNLEGPEEIGVAMGVCAHAIGTSKAIEFGEVETAMAGIALVLTGVVTSVVYVLFV